MSSFNSCALLLSNPPNAPSSEYKRDRRPGSDALSSSAKGVRGVLYNATESGSPLVIPSQIRIVTGGSLGWRSRSCTQYIYQLNVSLVPAKQQCRTVHSISKRISSLNPLQASTSIVPLGSASLFKNSMPTISIRVSNSLPHPLHTPPYLVLSPESPLPPPLSPLFQSAAPILSPPLPLPIPLMISLPPLPSFFEPFSPFASVPRRVLHPLCLPLGLHTSAYYHRLSLPGLQLPS